jgi:hypothetical protein
MHQGKFRIYRNLHKKCFSIQKYDASKRGYRLYAHEKEIYIPAADFKVYAAGRKKVLLEKSKNVHAFIICNEYLTSLPKKRILSEIYYNPYLCESFVRKDLGTPIFYAVQVVLKENKCYFADAAKK